jgi:4-hydroxybenzoate polyprenyltransferase
MVSRIRGAVHILSMLGKFIRFPTVSFSIILPLLGAAAVSSPLKSYQVLELLGVAMAFHIFAYVLNDVIDLPVDRTEPLRADDPLVQGTIQPRQALAVALLQIPVALILTVWLGANGPAYVFLAAAFLLMTVYDLWGKRTPFPPLTDFIQGLSWNALVLYGAAAVPGYPSKLLGIVIAFVVVFIMMINGVHGGLRDFANDLNCNVRTTAILLGVRLLDTGRVKISFLFGLYALTLQALLIAILLLPLVYNWFDYSQITWNIIAGIVLLFSLLSLITLIASAPPTHNRSKMLLFGTLHIVISLNTLLLLFVPHLDPNLLSALLLVYFVPLCNIVWYWLTNGLKQLRETERKVSQSL